MNDYTTILSRLKSYFREKAGFLPDDSSESGIRLQIIAAEFVDCYLYLEWVQSQLYIQTATGSYLDMHGEEHGLTRIQAVKAIGNVTFTLSEALTDSFTIPEGVVCATETGVHYVTVESAVLAAGETSVTVDVEALNSGGSGNASSGSICIIESDLDCPVKITVTNESSIYGGLSTEADDDFRKRIMESIRYPDSGCNCTYYKKIATGVSGVKSAGIVPSYTGAGTLAVFCAGEGTTVSSTVVSNVQTALDAGREANVFVTAYPAVEVPITVNMTVKLIPGYTENEVTSRCNSEIRKYFSSLSVGEKVTQKSLQNVAGKIEGIDDVSFSGTEDQITQAQLATLSEIKITYV